MKRHQLLAPRQGVGQGAKHRGNAWPARSARQWASPSPIWPRPPKRPLGMNKEAHPILVVLFDDVGFSDFGCYGSPIATPAIDALGAAVATPASTPRRCARPRGPPADRPQPPFGGRGLPRQLRFRYPGYRGKIAREAGTLAEMLRPHGYRNYMLGKWHVTPLTNRARQGRSTAGRSAAGSTASTASSTPRPTSTRRSWCATTRPATLRAPSPPATTSLPTSSTRPSAISPTTWPTIPRRHG